MPFNDECVTDTETPQNDVLSAKYKRSYAYITVRDRLPVTITNIIDYLVREKNQIINEYGEDAREELKEVIGSLSKLKNEVQTNKPFESLTSDAEDVDLWNEYEMKETERGREVPRWFRTSWLYAECYMYRRIRQSFELSLSLKMLDPFRKQKEGTLLHSMSAVKILADHIMHLIQRIDLSHSSMKEEILRLFKVTLWGNQYDLSRPIGSEIPQDNNPLENIDRLCDSILVDDSEIVWSALTTTSKEEFILDFINDNAGYEIFTDLCLADVLCSFSLVNNVRFHLKVLPWFISDTMRQDFLWVIQKLKEFGDISPSLPCLASRWEEYLTSGKWTLHDEKFWTLPNIYNDMKEIDPNLYSMLSEASLIVFKGDLNYRKLLGETNWPPTQSFATALREFHPAPLVTLRTVKADLICGLEDGQFEALTNKSSNWMQSGDYAVIQFDC